MSMLNTLLEGLKLAAHMAWETWWALVLGFTIAGVVERFVSEDRMTALLGGSGLKEISLGTFFGAASSSCSFGAVATTKSLFKKGASPASSLAAFQFASTNLVFELGLVMWILLGWEFVAANFVSGLILIVLLALLFRFVVPPAWFERSRQLLKEREGVRDPSCGMEVDPDAEDTVELDTEAGTVYFCSTSCRNTYEAGNRKETWTEKLFTVHGWKGAFQSAIGEWNMLWKDIVIGFLIAGLIGAFIPREWWTFLFEVGTEGTFTRVFLNCLIGVIVGVITFVCSVGNVPFALILWQNGIAFGGVMSFIFADLIVPTIVDAYRRYYGGWMAGVLFVGIFMTAVVSGFLIHYLWTSLGLTPPPGKLGGTAPGGYTLYLNALFTPLFLLQLGVRFADSTGGNHSDAGQ